MIAIRMTGRREQPVEDCDALAVRLSSLLRELQKTAPSGARWSILSRSYKQVPIYAFADLAKHLAASKPGRASERAPGAPTHRATLTCSAGKVQALHLSLRFCVAGDPAPRAALTAQLSIDGAMFSGTADPRARAADIFSTLVSWLELDAARAISGADSAPPPGDNAVRLGSLTFFPSRLGPLPPLPPGCDVVATLGSGCVLAAHRGLPEPGSMEQGTSLAHLRFVLGARVLLDGPAIPPPGLAAPPVVEEPASDNPPEDVPSYLKAASEEAPGRRSLPEPASVPPSTTMSALHAETGAIDVARLSKAPLPFDPRAAPSGAALQAAAPPRPRATSATAAVNVAEILKGPMPFNAGQPLPAREAPAAAAPAKGTPDKAEAQPPAAGFGETEEIQAGDLLKRGPPVPFPQASPAATTAEPSARSASRDSPLQPPTAVHEPPGRGRWIRFNPQTGEPLALPYWEELPPDVK
jgi:hypothetical protein